METRVVHCKKEPFDIYIGRPSIWGNPYSHVAGTLAKYRVNTREEAVKAYRHWITEGEGRHLLKKIDRLRGKVLGCWCAPQCCHGDVLIEIINRHAHTNNTGTDHTP